MFHWLQRLFSGRQERSPQKDGLAWFRLRYRQADGPTRCLRLLSRPQACGRVVLYYQPGETIGQLYLGVPAIHTRLLQRMAADFGFSIKPKPPELIVPPVPRLTAVTELPWEQPFVAQIANEVVTAAAVAGHGRGQASPPATGQPQVASWPPNGVVSGWRLPDNPWPGLTTEPSWNGQEPPGYLTAAAERGPGWLLGRSAGGVLHTAGRVNLYGRQAAVADWLVHQLAPMVADDPANLVIIDGAGDLVPRLKRKAAVTRLLGEQLAYIDMDAALPTGFNPLAAAPGETTAAQVERWQQWFQDMGVHPQGCQLLAQARQAGVEDIPALQKWLKAVERQGPEAGMRAADGARRRSLAAVSSLSLALNWLTADRKLREWLEWPVNRLDILPAGALFFACRATDWGRQQQLRAVLLGALAVSGVRLVVHGFPWKSVAAGVVDNQAQLVVGNGPRLPGSTVVLTECHPPAIPALTARFLAGDAQLAENLALLNRGEGILIAGDAVLFTTWQTQAEPGLTNR